MEQGYDEDKHKEYSKAWAMLWKMKRERLANVSTPDEIYNVLDIFDDMPICKQFYSTAFGPVLASLTLDKAIVKGILEAPCPELQRVSEQYETEWRGWLNAIKKPGKTDEDIKQIKAIRPFMTDMLIVWADRLLRRIPQ